MGYYHFELSPDSKRLYTIVLPWGKYEYQKLPMGLCNSPDIFQEKMSTLLGDLEYVRTYIDDLLITTKSNWHDHLSHLEIMTPRHHTNYHVTIPKIYARSTSNTVMDSSSGTTPTDGECGNLSNLGLPGTSIQLKH
jgi:hypothetical protein